MVWIDTHLCVLLNIYKKLQLDWSLAFIRMLVLVSILRPMVWHVWWANYGQV